MAYTTLTLSSIRSLLASRLHDSGLVHWESDELDAVITEGFRIFNSLTGHFRARGTFNTAAGTAFYDIPTELTDSGGTKLRAYTIRDRAVIENIQRHLCEPVGATTWLGSDQFTMQEVIDAISRRRNQFLYDTGCRLTEHSETFLTPPSGGRFELDESIMDVRRMVWKDADGRYHPLTRDDEHMMTPALNDVGTPRSYSIIAAPALTVQLAPIPQDRGTVEMLTVDSMGDIDPTASSNTGTLMGIPDDLVWAVMWGAIAELLDKDGPAFDPARAGHADRLYRLGVETALRTPVVLHGEVNGRATRLDPLHQADYARRGWQGKARGTPAVLALPAMDTIVTIPIPKEIGSVTLDVVRNAPVPSSGNIQIGREHLSAILGLAQFLAAFKEGGSEMQATIPSLQEFIAHAVLYNQKMAAGSVYREILQAAPYEEGSYRPRLQSVQRQPQFEDPDAERDHQRERRSRYS